MALFERLHEQGNTSSWSRTSTISRSTPGGSSTSATGRSKRTKRYGRLGRHEARTRKAMVRSTSRLKFDAQFRDHRTSVLTAGHVLFGVCCRTGNSQQVLRRRRTQHRVDVDPCSSSVLHSRQRSSPRAPPPDNRRFAGNTEIRAPAAHRGASGHRSTFRRALARAA